ncbi:restriction endonuclease subunit S, partial [Campylobacter sp. RM6883]|nr:restriction endonuclease subunit S [Campylobacter sp. RM6883]MBE2996031.1 restriction endonuclease subunit S [Campylobacter sp. RM6913]
DFFMGGTPTKSESGYWKGDIKWLTISDYSNFDLISQTKDKITNLGLENSSAKLIKTGSVVISIYATIGRVGILGCEMATNQAIVAMQPYKISNRYLMYALYISKNRLLKSANKTTQKNINLEILKNTLIPLPPLAEQERIVTKIEQILQILKS